MLKSRFKPIAYLNVAAGLLYVACVFYWISANDGYVKATSYSVIFIALFVGYFPVRAVLQKKHSKKQVYLFLTVPFIIVFLVINALAFG